MKLDKEFLRSKVARRIFTLFVVCALVPILCLAVLSFTLVSRQLEEQVQGRLHQASKSVGMSIIERLHMLDARLERMVVLYEGAGIYDLEGAQAPDGIGRGRFESISLTSVDESGLDFPPAIRAQLAKGNAALFIKASSNASLSIFLARARDPERLDLGILVGEIDTSYIWSEEILPPMTELAVLDDHKRLLFSTLTVSDAAMAIFTTTSRDHFEWKGANEAFIACAWPIPMKFSFGVVAWTVVLSESKANVLAPMTNFKTLFPLVVLVSLWLVLLLSVSQIRRYLIPLERLREGTRSIAEQHFDSRVNVASGDEFEELASSFNIMAGQLGRQFKTISTMSEIDRAILSTLKTREVVDTVVARLPDIVPCDEVSVTVMDAYTTGKARTYVSNDTSSESEEEREIGPDELLELQHHSAGMLIESKDFPDYLQPLAKRGIESALVIPTYSKKTLTAIITLGNVRPIQYTEEDFAQARQMAARAAVGLSNARLLEDLDQHNWETLITLARAIDASSPWTLGHSERGADLALAIGRQMRLSEDQLVHLHRGALLHDIGKLAIDRSVLDKQGVLTEEERRIMREHPRKGARILSAHRSYTKAVPVVEHHHECWDGTGYPDGLAGEEIDILARIYAVADVFDALITDRPYRAGLTHEKVVSFISERAGTQFDPAVVGALLTVLESSKEDHKKKPLTGSPLLTT